MPSIASFRSGRVSIYRVLFSFQRPIKRPAQTPTFFTSNVESFYLSYVIILLFLQNYRLRIEWASVNEFDETNH